MVLLLFGGFKWEQFLTLLWNTLKAIISKRVGFFIIANYSISLYKVPFSLWDLGLQAKERGWAERSFVGCAGTESHGEGAGCFLAFDRESH